jgi:hypothetical protein
MTRLIVLLIFVVLSCDCGNSSQDELFWQWRVDKIGCDRLRSNVVNQHFKGFESIILGKPESYILDKLGEPNERFKRNNTEIFSYFAAPGIQCMDKSSREIDVLRLTLELQNGVVQDVGIILP